MRLLAVAAALCMSPLHAEIAYLGLSEGGYWQAWTMADDGTSQRVVTGSMVDKTRVSWFPDGATLLVNAADGRVQRVDAGTGHEVEIQMPFERILDAVVSPDGMRIAFSISTSGSVDDNNIWVVSIDGSDARKLTSMPRLQHEPSWDPSGTHIYFLSGEGEQVHDIWRVDVETRRAEQLTANDLYHFDVAIAPGGTMAYSSNRSGNYEIWLDGPAVGRRQLTSHDGLDARPTWSPDSKALAFESSRSGAMQIWRIPVAGGNAVQLTDVRGGARFPVWRSSR